MNTRQKAIDSLIRATRNRAIRESLAALFVIFVSAGWLQSSAPYSADYFGSLIILVGSGFIMGMLWCCTLTHGTLAVHPESDLPFWRAAFESQARLLSNVPLWYIAPLFVGVTLRQIPGAGESYMAFVCFESIWLAACAAVIWLNRTAAERLYREAGAHFSEQTA